MSDWLVAICAGRWQVSGILAARAVGLRVFAIDGDASAPGLALADRSAVADVRDPAAVIAAVRDAGIAPVGAVAFVTEAGMPAVGAVRDAFGLPGGGLGVIRRLTDKGCQRAAWTAAGLPCPDWQVVTDADAAAALVTCLDAPLIFKPTDSAGSRGVGVMEAGEDWRPLFDAARAGSRSGQVIIERFVRATEYTVETISIDGRAHVLAVTEKRKVPGSRGTVAMELATPGLPAEQTAAIGQLACRALEALGYYVGPGHTEILRTDAGELWLVESAGRGGGFMVADGIVPRASGYDLALATALAAVGRTPPTPPTEGNAIVLRFLPSRPGRVEALAGFEDANALSGVECGPLVSIGQVVGKAASDGDRLAYIVTWHGDRAQALALADQAERLLRVTIVEDGACRTA